LNREGYRDTILFTKQYRGIFIPLPALDDLIMEKKPLILISNDDGYNAPGIHHLIEWCRPLGEVLVVAPDSGRSGMSAAITVTVPLRMKLVKEEPGLVIFKTNGTPVDCVKLALNQVLTDRKPDVVFSGINHGTNVSVAVHYSGTMGAVIEACINSIPAVGFSLDDHTWEANFEPARPYIKSIAENVIRKGLPDGCFLNVNIPAVTSLKGMKLCRQARGRWIEEFDIRTHPKGGNYYWLTGNFYNDEPDAPDTDMYALKEGYLSIVPSRIDLTDHLLLEAMTHWELANLSLSEYGTVSKQKG
jgi:5'-nucleotidase